MLFASSSYEIPCFPPFLPVFFSHFPNLSKLSLTFLQPPSETDLTDPLSSSPPTTLTSTSLRKTVRLASDGSSSAEGSPRSQRKQC